MNYELAKQLKDAGFPQKWVNGKFYAENDVEFKDIAEYQYKLGFINNAPKFISIPTLEELIEACGDRFDELNKLEHNGKKSKWMCISYSCEECGFKDMIQARGSTPEEAVANLWLKLNP